MGALLTLLSIRSYSVGAMIAAAFSGFTGIYLVITMFLQRGPWNTRPWRRPRPR